MIDTSERAKNKMGNTLVLYRYEDEEEGDNHHSVAWRGLCGYFSVQFRCATPEQARKLYEALQDVCEVSET